MDCIHQIPLESYLFRTLTKEYPIHYLTVYEERYSKILPGDILDFIHDSTTIRATVEEVVFYKFCFEPFVHLDLRKVLIDLEGKIENKDYKVVAIKYNFKPNLVLDLDETLVHAIQESPVDISPHGMKLSFPNDNFRVYTRPNLEIFIEELSELYNIYVYSNGLHDYVHDVCEKLEHRHKILKIISRDDPTILDYKHLEQWGLDPKKTIIVDDRLDVWDPIYHANIVLVPRFCLVDNMFINANDELLSLKGFLKIAHRCYSLYPKDIRNYL